MSNTHKGSWSRVKDKKAWDECPLWDKKKKEVEKAKIKEKTKNKSPKEV